MIRFHSDQNYFFVSEVKTRAHVYKLRSSKVCEGHFFMCWIWMRNELWSNFEAWHIAGYSLITCSKWCLIHCQSAWKMNFATLSSQIDFRSNLLVWKWSKIHFSVNLKVDQTSLWPRDERTTREDLTPRKWINVHFAWIFNTWSPSHTGLSNL